MDEFRMQPSGWTKPVTLDEMIAETARSIGLGRDDYYLATDADDRKDATEIITAAREYERALICDRLRELHEADTADLIENPHLFPAIAKEATE